MAWIRTEASWRSPTPDLQGDLLSVLGQMSLREFAELASGAEPVFFRDPGMSSSQRRTGIQASTG